MAHLQGRDFFLTQEVGLIFFGGNLQGWMRRQKVASAGPTHFALDCQNPIAEECPMLESQLKPFVVDESDRQRAVEELMGLRPRFGNVEELCGPSANIAQMYLPPHVLQSLHSIADPDGRVVQVIENMPTDIVLPCPPTDGKRPSAKSTYVSESALIGPTIAAGFDLMTFAQEKNGAIPQEVAPVFGLENSNSSASREEFGAHADNSILDEKVRVLIALIGLVNECETETYFASLEDTLSALPSKTVDLLFQRLYKVRYPESFQMGDDFTKTQSVLYKAPDGATEVKFSAWNIVGINREAEDALTALRNVLPTLLRPIVLKKGTFVLFSNTRCFHSRGRIEGQRWAQRIYCCKPDTLATLQHATGAGPGKRVFDARQLVNL